MFGIFKRNNSAANSAAVKTRSFQKAVGILNYTPIEYRETRRFADYSDPAHFEAVHAKEIKDMKVDEMCGDMYDFEIDGEAALMKDSARQQLIYKLAIIDHHKGIIDGKLALLPMMTEKLTDDLADIDKCINELESKTTRRNVHVR